jgi:hypothetical protein
VNSKEGNSLDFCLDFVQEFGLFMRSSAGHFDQRGDIQGTHLPNGVTFYWDRLGQDSKGQRLCTLVEVHV